MKKSYRLTRVNSGSDETPVWTNQMIIRNVEKDFIIDAWESDDLDHLRALRLDEHPFAKREHTVLVNDIFDVDGEENFWHDILVMELCDDVNVASGSEPDPRAPNVFKGPGFIGIDMLYIDRLGETAIPHMVFSLNQLNTLEQKA